ncbi:MULTISPECIES: ABC transporter ATP-binding protein [Paenibacillus]|uniref:ABC transporter ATP-binding protein n=1 Tax=Paenibacillus TaxID=44249 RepID=UPI0022B8741F|nr:ABC transporter ATP-binding protein [Paenibacillus caseinilyticus]MCZ8521456.1 ABC transporter ATP-binding protein [Paenibacillus caseinilyticus]
MASAVKLEEITHVYVNGRGAYPALQEVSFTVEQGEFVSLIGPSGCGKTTLLSLISGLLTPTSGSLQVFGEPVRQGGVPRIGYMLQQDYLFPWRTIGANAALGLELLGRLDSRTQQYVDELLAEMGLEGQAHRYPHQLSGGMRQRVALVRTLATDPDVLLLDEPFSALDYQTKLQLEELVACTLKSRGKTAVLVTHDITEAVAMSDRVIVLQPNPGRLLADLAVPEAIRETTPLKARESEGFHELFHRLWGLFESMEKRGGGAAHV